MVHFNLSFDIPISQRRMLSLLNLSFHSHGQAKGALEYPTAECERQIPKYKRRY
jgi:hypothetical protein